MRPPLPPLKSTDLSFGTPMMLRLKCAPLGAPLPVASADSPDSEGVAPGAVAEVSQPVSARTASVANVVTAPNCVRVACMRGPLWYVRRPDRHGARSVISRACAVASWLCVPGFHRVCPCRTPADGCRRAERSCPGKGCCGGQKLRLTQPFAVWRRSHLDCSAPAHVLISCQLSPSRWPETE